MENGSGDYTRLESASFTVEQVSFRKIPSFLTSTSTAHKSIWPSLSCKVLSTCFVIWKFLLKFYQTTFFVFLGHLSTCPRIYLKFD